MRRRGLVVHDTRLDPTPHNIRVNNLPDMHPVFMELLQNPTALAVARGLLGDAAIVSNFTANVAYPGAGSMNLHSDQALIVPGPWREGWVLNVIWCLDDVTPENGGTLYVPRSHKYEDRADLPADAESRMKAFSAPAGSVIVMEGRLWHTSGINTTADERRALLFALYGRPFLRQQVNWDVLLSEATKARLTAEDRTLLGMGPLSNIYGVDLVMREGHRLDEVQVL